MYKSDISEPWNEREMNKEKIIAFRNATSKPRGSWSLKLVRNLPRKDEDEIVNTVIPQVTLPPHPFLGNESY